MEKQCTDSLSELLKPYASRVEDALERWLIERGVPEELEEVMRYCALGGGKRFRPALVYMSAEAVGGDRDDELLDRASVAVELVHSYSLVHDDLPWMDDDVLRRGRATAHVQFGEAMAVLGGDALLTRAFGVLGDADTPLCGRLITELTRGAGAGGMIAGQVADMDLCRVPEGSGGIRYIQLHKTAALIRSAGRMGAICAGADGEALEGITRYSESLGLTFQVIDDMLDVIGVSGQIGKTPGKDARSGKKTQISELGLEGCRQLGRRLTQESIDSLAALGEGARKLQTLAELLLERTR